MRAEFVVPVLFSLFSVILALSRTDYDYDAQCNQATGTFIIPTDQCLKEDSKSAIYSCNSSILTVKKYSQDQCVGSISVSYVTLNVCLNESRTSSVKVHSCSSETAKVSAYFNSSYTLLRRCYHDGRMPLEFGTSFPIKPMRISTVSILSRTF